MIDRRELLAGAACLAAVGSAEWLRPRRIQRLMTAPSLESVVPPRFGPWVVGADGDLVIPETPGSLATRLYSDRLARVYDDADGGAPVMLLIAYGSAQTDLLQLHRPESCYPAVGFSIANRRLVTVAVGGARLPAVALTAEAPGRIEDVVYWSRLGDALPQSAGEQRSARLAAAMDGVIPDGILVRGSAVRPPGQPDQTSRVTDFLSRLVEAVPPAARDGFVGDRYARAMD